MLQQTACPARAAAFAKLSSVAQRVTHLYASPSARPRYRLLVMVAIASFAFMLRDVPAPFLIDIDEELIAEPSGENLVGRGHDRPLDRSIEPSKRSIGFGCRVLDENRCGDEFGGARKPLMGKFSTARAVCTP
jgi:hypothetical protein